MECTFTAKSASSHPIHAKLHLAAKLSQTELFFIQMPGRRNQNAGQYLHATGIPQAPSS